MPRKKKHEVKYYCDNPDCEREIMVIDNVLHGGLCTKCFLRYTKMSAEEKKDIKLKRHRNEC